MSEYIRDLKAVAINYKILLQEKLDSGTTENPELTQRAIQRVEELLTKVNAEINEVTQ